MQGLSKQERIVFDVFAQGGTERECGRRLRCDESKVWEILDRVRGKIQARVPTTLDDYKDLVQLERIERKLLQREVAAGEARLAALMDTAPEAIFVIAGRTGRILQANNNAVLMFGYTPRELSEMIMEELIVPSKRAIHEMYRTGFLNSGRKREMGYHPPIYALHKDGHRFSLDIALTATSQTDDVMVVCQYAEPVTSETHVDASQAEL